MNNELLEKTLSDFYAQFVKFQNLKNIQGIHSCLHKESVMARAMIQNFEGLFDHFTLDISVLSHQYVSSDDDYVYCRFKQQIEKISGPEFKNIQAENLVLFKQEQEQEQWKIWNCFPLVIEPL